MHGNNPKRVIVFDLFNTLVFIPDRNNPFRKLYQAMKNELPYSRGEYGRLMMSHAIEELFTLMPERFQLLYEEIEAEITQEVDAVQAVPGVYELLEGLRKENQLFLVSNLSTPYKKAFYRLGLDVYFEQAIFSCDVGCTKPDRGIFRIVEEASGASGKDITMIGDSMRSDVAGAKKMGWSFIRINQSRERLREFEVGNVVEVASALAEC